MRKILNFICTFLLICLKGSFSIQGKYTKNVNKYQITYPIKLSNANIDNSENNRYRRSQNNLKPTAVHYKLNLGGNNEYIDLIPNPHILSPGAVLEYRSNITSEIDPLINIELGNFSLQECFFKGKVRNYDDSSTALSTCGGLCGYIRVKRRTFFIEPVNKRDNVTHEEDLPHLIYEHFDIGKNPINCATKQDYESNVNYIHKTCHQSNRKKLSNYDELNFSIKPYHIETLLVLDKSMMDLHNQKDIQNYALTVFNMAQSLFHDLSSKPPINLEIVRMIQVEDEKDNLNIRKKRQRGSVELQGFSEWQLRINPKEENHPNHHDLAILLTGSDLCDDKDSCHYVGIAEYKGTCRPEKQAAICKDSGLILGYIIAHEIAHTLGVGHDLGRNGGCKQEMIGGLFSVMSPVISFKSREWSDCSRMSLMSAIDKRQLRCLEDEPTTKVHVADILPGVLYNADYQCQQLFNMDAKSCNIQGDCQSLTCEFEGASCSKTGVMPAPGTWCGENKWCYDGECLEAGKRPKAVQGNWGPWSSWSQCSRTCGAGVATSTRECDSPTPLHGGKTCVGIRRRHKICTTQPCPIGSRPFRDVQCAEYDDWIFPEDGKRHNWKGFFINSGNPCALYCRNERNVVVSISPKVKDGTTCYRGIRDICVDGLCRDIPCDMQFDSNSVEDACGVCHGDGTGCEVLQGHKPVEEGISKILTIPTGTRNIIVEEKNQLPSQLLLKDIKTFKTINDGKKLGIFNVSGGIAWLGMMKPNQEILEIPGPLMEPIDLWISSDGQQSVTYSMGLPSNPRKGKYSWDYIDWSPCLAQCGESTQESVPKCVELSSGRVEDKYCEYLEKPFVKTRYCNAGNCISRWLIGEWQKCGPCPNKEAKRFRLVRCIKPIAGSENGIEIVEDKVCSGARPIASEYCRCIKRQVGYWPLQHPKIRSKTYSDGFSSLLKLKYNKESKSTKSPEKKLTLMQLENENEESMLKQFKENQHKHHSLLYMPHFLASRFNFSIPFKKRQIMKNQTICENMLDYFNKNILRNNQYYPKYFPFDCIAIQIQENYPNVTYSDNNFPLVGSRYPFDSFEKITCADQSDYSTLNFSVPNVLKLLSDNLSLKLLNQQQELRQNNDKLKSVNIKPNMFLTDNNFGHYKENYNSSKIGILDLLMNDFYNILAVNAFINANITKSQKDNTNITTILGNAKKQSNKLFMRIFKNIYSNIIHNSSQIAEPVSKSETIPNFHYDLKQNDCKYCGNGINDLLDGIMKVRAKTFVINKQGEIESNLYSKDNNWNSLLETFFKHIIPTGLDQQIVNLSLPEHVLSAFPEVSELATVSTQNACNKKSKTNVTLYSYPQMRNNEDK